MPKFTFMEIIYTLRTLVFYYYISKQQHIKFGRTEIIFSQMLDISISLLVEKKILDAYDYIRH